MFTNSLRNSQWTYREALQFLGVLVFGTCLRLPGILDSFLYFFPVRQIRSLLISRGFSTYLSNDLPGSMILKSQLGSEGILEPPFFESVLSPFYLLTPEFHPQLGMLINLGCWFSISYVLYRVIRPYSTKGNALLALVVFQCFPVGIEVSRSLLPDVLMFLVYVLGLRSFYMFFLHHEKAQKKYMVLYFSLSLLVKPLVLPAIFVLMISRAPSMGVRTLFKLLGFILFIPGIYYFYRLGVDPFMQNQFRLSFNHPGPGFIGQVRDWALLLESACGRSFLLIVIPALLLCRSSPHFPILLSLSISQVLFFLLFRYHASTHTYYHFQAILPCIIALSALLNLIRGRKNVKILLVFLLSSFIYFYFLKSIEFRRRSDSPLWTSVRNRIHLVRSKPLIDPGCNVVFLGTQGETMQYIKFYWMLDGPWLSPDKSHNWVHILKDRNSRCAENKKILHIILDQKSLESSQFQENLGPDLRLHLNSPDIQILEFSP